MDVVLVAVVDQRSDRQAMRRRPDDIAGPPARRQGPFQAGGLARVVAGPASSPAFTIDVRYPLAIKSFDVALRPPAYTRMAPSTIKGGDVHAVEGTAATFRVTFDAPLKLDAKGALMVDAPLGRTPKEAEEGALDSMIGCDAATLDILMPLLRCWAKAQNEVNAMRSKRLTFIIPPSVSEGAAPAQAQVVVNWL